MYTKVVKRILDLVISGLFIIVLSPLFLFIAIWIKKDSRGPILFRQNRIGKNCIEFQILKFRSMRIDTPSDIPTAMLDNPEAFITKSGVFLRKTSLDELPQLINIFKGDMSFVGPRPALWNQYDLIELREKSGVNAVLPGLTGLAQISGRDELPISVKAKYDTEYTRYISIGKDIRIIRTTFANVVSQKGIKEGRWEMEGQPKEDDD